MKEDGETHRLIGNYLNGERNVVFNPIQLVEDVELHEFTFEPLEIISGEDFNFTIRLVTKENKLPEIQDFCLLIFSEKGVRVSIIDLRPFIKYFERDGNTLSLKAKVENMNLVEGEYSIGLFYVINEVRKEVMDIHRIRMKPGLAQHPQVKPYLSQYRGHVELMNKIKIA